MEKNFAETRAQVSTAHQSPELEPASEEASKTAREKTRGEHFLNVCVSYELKDRLLALAERYDLSQADLIRQVIKAGLPVFESLSTSQEELLGGFIRLLRKSRSMGKLK